MKNTIVWMTAFSLLAGTAAEAQDRRVEISGTAAWTFSDGVTGDDVTVPGVGLFDTIDPKDAFSWGARLGFLVGPKIEIGGLFSQQSTQIEIGGSRTVELGDISVRNYHGYFAYNFGESDGQVRPYLLGGLGVTQYGSIAVNAGSVQRDIDGNTKFSTTWAAGVKVFPGESFGIRLEARWTPTYIKTDATGWWCDPYWGCYATGDSQYSNQFELGGGITLRF